jgi:hypothetical protein
MYIAESNLKNSAPTTSCANCYWEHYRGTYWEHLGTQNNNKSIFPTPPNINTSPPHCIVSWLIDYMQIQFLQLVVTIFSLN